MTTTRDAILGLLALEPMSGYDIRRASTDALAHFWHESYGQIYPALAALEREKLIRLLPAERASGRPRKVYALTSKGRQALAAWQRRPAKAKPFRNELLLKLFTGTKASARRHVARVRKEEEARMKTYERLAARLAKEGNALWVATLRYGVHRSRAILAWCAETEKAL